MDFDQRFIERAKMQRTGVSSLRSAPVVNPNKPIDIATVTNLKQRNALMELIERLREPIWDVSFSNDKQTCTLTARDSDGRFVMRDWTVATGYRKAIVAISKQIDAHFFVTSLDPISEPTYHLIGERPAMLEYITRHALRVRG